MADPHPTPPTIPSTPASSPPSKPPRRPPHPSALPSLLLTSLHKTDRTLLRLSALLSSPASTDALLSTTCYTLTLLHALLSRLLSRRLSAIAHKLDALLLPGETLIATLPAPPSTKLLAHFVGAAKPLADTIADYRVFVRLWGLLDVYTWARGVYLSPVQGPEDKVQRRVACAGIASCVAFQVLENGAYLSSKGALTGAGWAGAAGKARETRWWLWSSRFWAAYVACELARLGVARWYRSGRADGAEDEGEKEGKIRREEMRLQDWLWWRDLVSNVAYAPLTLHWSVDGGLLSDVGVGACGVVAGGALLADAWRKTK